MKISKKMANTKFHMCNAVFKIENFNTNNKDPEVRQAKVTRKALKSKEEADKDIHVIENNHKMAKSLYV